MKCYIVITPREARGIYDTWDECKAAVAGLEGARYRKVPSREVAEKILYGGGVVMPEGTYFFTDGNAQGGVGVVRVEQDADDKGKPTKVGMTVFDAFRDCGIAGLETDEEVAGALAEIHNILTELAAAFWVFRNAEKGSEFTLVHDYVGVAHWIEGTWKMKNAHVKAVVAGCLKLKKDRRLKVTFQHQPGHQSARAGRDDYARWNGHADKLATEAVEQSG